MNSNMKRKTAVILLSAWALMLVFCFTERLGYFHDADEYAGQWVEETLSSPAEPSTFNFSKATETLASCGFAAVLLICLIAPSLPSGRLPLLSMRYGPPRTSRIFQLLSTYRI